MAKKKSSKSKKSQQSLSHLVILFLLFLATVGVFFVAMKDKEEKEMAAVEGAATRAAEAKLKRPPCLSFGDVNGDGVINEKDAAEITRKIQGSKPAKKYLYQNADVDGDKKVTSKDKELILKYAQKKITNLPVCPPRGKKCTSVSDCSTGGTCEKGYCVPSRPFPTKVPVSR